jgi:hypothetical protein
VRSYYQLERFGAIERSMKGGTLGITTMMPPLLIVNHPYPSLSFAIAVPTLPEIGYCQDFCQGCIAACPTHVNAAQPCLTAYTVEGVRFFPDFLVKPPNTRQKKTETK